jgi:periplasmic divalent cation tolerance protein
MTDKIVVFSNCGSATEARKIARHLVELHLAACVNIVPAVHSIYQWQGKVEEEEEWMLMIKSTRPLFDRLKIELQKMHSYQVPEVIALAIVDGSTDYLSWIEKETAGEDGKPTG